MLPESTDTWPRRVFAIARAEGVQAVGLTLIQESPRDNYKVAYAVTLVATVPDVAPAELGASALPPGNNLGLLAPEELAAAYGDVLINGDASEFADLFDADDSVQEAIGVDYKAERRSQLPTSATIEFTNGPGTEDPIAFLTNDSGQIVSLILEDVDDGQAGRGGGRGESGGSGQGAAGQGAVDTRHRRDVRRRAAVLRAEDERDRPEDRACSATRRGSSPRPRSASSTLAVPSLSR